MSIKGADIRNIAVIGHSGEGKTSVCEAILFNGKTTDRLGKVTDGNTVTDYDDQEIARKMSISLSMAYTMWDGVKLNLLDVPGFYDFEGEENEALRAAGGALIVTGASGTLSVGAEKAIDKCLKNKIPMILFINGVDKDNADYAGTVAALKQKYAGKIAPIQIPIMPQLAAQDKAPAGHLAENGEVLPPDHQADPATLCLLPEIFAAGGADLSAPAGGSIAVDQLQGRAAHFLGCIQLGFQPTQGCVHGGHTMLQIQFFHA